MTQDITSQLPTKTAKLIFRYGDGGTLISNYEGMIVIAQKGLDVKPMVSYECTIRSMLKGNGFIAIKAEKLPPVKATLKFKRGKDGDMISTYEEGIVIAPDSIPVGPFKKYDCELVLSPQGKAYIVESAVLSSEQDIVDANLNFKMGNKGNMVSNYNNYIVICPDNIEVEPFTQYDCNIALSPRGNAYVVTSAIRIPERIATIIKSPYPICTVEVKLDDELCDELVFDYSLDDRTVLAANIERLYCMNIIMIDEAAQEYRKACEEGLKEMQEITFGRNKNLYKK